MLLDQQKIKWSPPDAAMAAARESLQGELVSAVPGVMVFTAIAAGALGLWMMAFGLDFDPEALLVVVVGVGVFMGLLVVMSRFAGAGTEAWIDSKRLAYGSRRLTWDDVDYYRIDEPTDERPYFVLALYLEDEQGWGYELLERLAGAPPPIRHRWVLMPLPADDQLRREVVDEVVERCEPMANASDADRERVEMSWERRDRPPVEQYFLRTWAGAAGWLAFTLLYSPLIVGAVWVGIVPDLLGWRPWLFLHLVLLTFLGPATWIALVKYERRDLAKPAFLAQLFTINGLSMLISAGMSTFTTIALIEWFGLP